MTSDLDAKLAKIDADLDELVSPTTRDVYEATLPFDKKMVAAAIGKKALNAGVGDLPAGGSTGEVLTKASNADGDADWEAPTGGSSSLLGRRTLMATEIYSLDTVPVEIIPDPDPDVTLLIDKALYRFIPGTIPFAEALPIGWLWGVIDPGSTVQVPTDGSVDKVTFHSPYNDLDSTSQAVDDILGKGISVQAANSMAKKGAITAVTVGPVGADYAPGDTGTITQDASNDATYEVDTVDGSGGITALTLTDGGTAYLAQNAQLTNGGAQPGIGTGGGVVIESTDESVVGDGELEVILYGIATTDLA